MSILVNGDTSVITIGITGKQGSFHSMQCREYGTNIVGGGDPIIGTTFIDALDLFNKDPDTDLVMIGEIGGNAENEAAHWVQTNMTKPVVGFIGGVSAPPGKRMGHAGAIISGDNDTAEAKMKILESCGVTVSNSPAEIGRIVMEQLH